MAAARAGAFDIIEVKRNGMNINFKETHTVTQTIVTFTEVESDSFKLTFHQLLSDGTTHDLLLRNTDPRDSHSVYEDQCIIVRENLHITAETAKQIWSYLSREREFMSNNEINDEGKRFSQLTMFGTRPVTAVIHYLERIAISLHDQEKRQAEALAKDAKVAARAASSKADADAKAAFKLTPEYVEQMKMKQLEQEQLDAAAEAAAAARRAKYNEQPTGSRRAKGGPKGEPNGGTRRPSRKYKKSKRVLRRKSRSTRRR